MESEKSEPSRRVTTIVRIALFASFFVILSEIPLSPFVGASSLLTMNLILVPVLAMLLPFGEGFASVLIGGTIAIYINPVSATFGPLTLLLPLAGVIFGSLAEHETKLSFLASVFLGVVVVAYLAARPEFPFWIAPHLVALVLAATATAYKSRAYHVPAFSFLATMCEQGMMLMLAVFMLNLPWVVFLTAFPLMLVERAVGTIGGSILIVALRRRLPNRLMAAQIGA